MLTELGKMSLIHVPHHPLQVHLWQGMEGSMRNRATKVLGMAREGGFWRCPMVKIAVITIQQLQHCLRMALTKRLR